MGLLDPPSYSRAQTDAAFVAKRVHLKSTDMYGTLPAVHTTPLLPSPNILSVVTSTTGGAMPAGIYFYRVSATSAAGESLASIGNRVTTTGATSSAAVHWPQIPGATGYKVYRSVAAGGAEFAEQLLASIGSGATLTYTDNGSVTPAGALPTSNNTSPTLVTVGAPTLTNPATGNFRTLSLLDSQSFNTYGAPLAADVNNAVHPAAFYSAFTSPPPFFVDSYYDGDYIVVWGSGGALTLLIDGKLTHAKPFSTTPCLPSNGNNYYHRFDLPPGRKRVQFLVNNMKVLGVIVPATSTIQATTKRVKLAVIPADSFGEPTIGDNLGNPNLTNVSGTLRGSVVFDGLGFAQNLNFLFPEWDARPVASGGTGNLNTGTTGAGRVKMRDRINDALNQYPHEVWHAMGVNDSSFSYAAEYAEARLLYQTCAAHPSSPAQRVLHNLWPRQANGQSSGFLAIGDALQDAAAAEGLPFVNLNDSLLPYGAGRPPAGTLGASVAQNANSFQSSIPFLNGQLVKVGRGDVGNVDVILVANSTGTGPYTVTLSAGQMPSSHAAGEPVRVFGPSSRTGLGNQGAPSGLGNSDKGVCSDATHDTSGWIGSGGVERRAERFALGLMTTVQSA
jgi:hypothetical protein